MEEIIDYTTFLHSRDLELFEALLENSLLSNEFDVKEFLKSKEVEGQKEAFQIALKKISTSKILHKKNLFRDIKEQLNNITSYKYQKL